MTLTSQYIKFITDSQRRLEDEEVRDNWLRIPNKLNYNMNLTNQTNNQPKNNTNSAATETHAYSLFLCNTRTYIYMVDVRVTNSSFAQGKHKTLACCSWSAGFLREAHSYSRHIWQSFSLTVKIHTYTNMHKHLRQTNMHEVWVCLYLHFKQTNINVVNSLKYNEKIQHSVCLCLRLHPILLSVFVPVEEGGVLSFTTQFHSHFPISGTTNVFLPEVCKVCPSC